MAGRGCLLLLSAVLLSQSVVLANFHPGDFVPMARRAQFHGTRTHFHDVLGRHCPRFSTDKTVSMPLPRPVGFLDEDDYKISLSINGDRLLTPWLKILGKGTPEVPMINMELVYSGAEVIKVKAEVLPVPPSFLKSHSDIVESYHNTSAWPKQLLMHYKWTESVELDVNRGLYVMFSMAFCFVGVILWQVAKDSEDKIRHFLDDVVDEEPGAEGQGEKKE